MAQYRTLHELIEKDTRSKALYESFSPDTQVALQEVRQDIHTYEDLMRLSQGFARRERG